MEVSVFRYSPTLPVTNVDPTFVTATFATMPNDAAVPRSIWACTNPVNALSNTSSERFRRHMVNRPWRQWYVLQHREVVSLIYGIEHKFIFILLQKQASCNCKSQEFSFSLLVRLINAAFMLPDVYITLPAIGGSIEHCMRGVCHLQWFL